MTHPTRRNNRAQNTQNRKQAQHHRERMKGYKYPNNHKRHHNKHSQHETHTKETRHNRCARPQHTSGKGKASKVTENQWTFPQAHLGGRGGPHEGRAQGPGHLQDNRQGFQHIHKDDKHTRGRQLAVSLHCTPAAPWVWLRHSPTPGMGRPPVVVRCPITCSCPARGAP